MNTMGPSTSTTSRALPALLAAAVVSIVLGIIGMHALDTHAVAGNTDHAVTSQMTDSHTDVSHGLSVVPGSRGPAGLVPEGDSGLDMSGMVMVCLAILAATAGALLLLLLGLRRIPRVWAHLRATPTTATRWVTARVGTGPPPVWEFSVVRC